MEDGDLEEPLLDEHLNQDLGLIREQRDEIASGDSIIPYAANHQIQKREQVTISPRMRRATRFLSDPRLSGTNNSQQHRFLEQKGYSEQEINEAQVFSERVIKAKRLLEHPRLQHMTLNHRISFIQSKYCTAEEVEEAVRLLDKASFLKVKTRKGEIKKRPWSTVLKKLLTNKDEKKFSTPEKNHSVAQSTFWGQQAFVISGSIWKNKNIFYMASSLVTLSSLTGLVIFLVIGSSGGQPASVTPSVDIPEVDDNYSYYYQIQS